MSLTGSREYSVIITDTSCFITLDKIGAFEVLRETFKNIVTTPEIQQEFGEGLPSWVKIRAVGDKTLQEAFKETVDPGEASAIALAMETSNAILIVDDLKGRKLASKMALNFMGTLGLLVKAKEYGIIPAVKPYIEKIQNTDFRVSASLVDVILVKQAKNKNHQNWGRTSISGISNYMLNTIYTYEADPSPVKLSASTLCTMSLTPDK